MFLFVRLGVVLSAGVVALGLAPVAGAETAHTCFGQAATMVGTNDPDFIYGYDRVTDVIVGLGEADDIDGHSGSDYLCGSDGGDRIFGKLGIEWLAGGPAGDSLYGHEGPDKIYGGRDRDVVGGDQGSDLIHGGRAGDFLYGGPGVDRIHGDAGVDECHVTPEDKVFDCEVIVPDESR